MSAGETGGKSGLGGRRKEQREKFECATIPALKTGKALEHLGRGVVGLDAVQDPLEGGRRLLEGGQNLAAQERDQRGS